MKRKKRVAIKLLAVGFAVAAFAAPSAQSMPPPEDLPGDQVRALHKEKAKARQAAAGAVRSTERARQARQPIRVYEPEVSG